MAKWGEGDPRWLVEDRPDATNVNNWHWTEKNASQWSKKKFTDLLVGLKSDDPIGTWEITEMSKCEGDAAVNNRKAKLIFFYEWLIELKWKGIPKDDDAIITGSFEILNLSEEHDIKDVDIIVHVNDTSPTAQKFKEVMLTKGIQIVKQKLSIYLSCLKEEFSRGVILPTKDEKTSVNKINKSILNKKCTEAKVEPNSASKGTFEVGDLTSTETFKCNAEEFYSILTTYEKVCAFTNGDSTLDPVKGGKFRMYGGNVEGEFIELIPNKMIKQLWRFKTWPAGHFSEVTLMIHEKSDCTEVVVNQKNVPKSELDNTSVGWNRYYWESIKRVFGLGAILF